MGPTLGNLSLKISGEDNHSRQLNKIIVVKYLIVQLVIKSAELTLKLVHGVVILSHFQGQKKNTEDVVTIISLLKVDRRTLKQFVVIYEQTCTCN